MEKNKEVNCLQRRSVCNSMVLCKVWGRATPGESTLSCCNLREPFAPSTVTSGMKAISFIKRFGRSAVTALVLTCFFRLSTTIVCNFFTFSLFLSPVRSANFNAKR